PGVAITIIPSSDPANMGAGIRVLAQHLAKDQRIDATGCLVRYTAIPRLSSGGDRRISQHLQSIRVEPPVLVDGRLVFLLDDIATTGNSLCACKQLLLEAGAGVVKCIVLGRTTY